MTDRRERRTLLGLQTADGRWVYPRFQFDERNEVISGLGPGAPVEDAVVLAFGNDFNCALELQLEVVEAGHRCEFVALLRKKAIGLGNRHMGWHRAMELCDKSRLPSAMRTRDGNSHLDVSSIRVVNTMSDLELY